MSGTGNGYHLVVSSDLSNLVHVLEWFETCNHAVVPQRAYLQCKIALAEAFTNAVRHAHRFLPASQPIEIHVLITPMELTLEVFDMGPPFAMKDYLYEQLKNVDLQATTGRGLALLESIADQWSYIHLPDGLNCLKIVKRY